MERIAQLDRRALRELSTAEFLRGWHALLFLFPGLHTDNALDHGDDIEEVSAGQLGLPGLEKVLARRHTRSGWPVALDLVAREAGRRYEANALHDDEFYCAEAQRAGLLLNEADDPTRHHSKTNCVMRNETNKLLRRLGGNIRARRDSLKITQVALARKARISVTHLAAIERGQRSVSLLCLARIAKAMRTTTENLCEAIEDGTRQPRQRQAT